jgi:type VI secretion system protein ImpM
MSAADMRTGFYGKMPATGDFVARGLPAGFVQKFDRWLAQHLAPMIDGQSWDESVALRFLSGPGAFGPAAGVVLASRDRIGRCFPLALVALDVEPSIELVAAGEQWFSAVEMLGRAAQAGELTADELNAALFSLPAPGLTAKGERVEGMVVWTEHSDIYELAVDEPGTVLKPLLGVATTVI